MNKHLTYLCFCLGLKKICFCSPLVVPVVKGEVAMATDLFSSSFLSSPHFSLTEFSITSLKLLHFFKCLYHNLIITTV